MAGFRLVIVFVLVVGGVGCAPVSDNEEFPAALIANATGPPLVNDQWRIVKMAMAHDIFTIEMEVSDPLNASAVAHELVEPLQSQYSEILVYLYVDGEGAGGHIPLKRIEWTDADGFSELEY